MQEHAAGKAHLARSASRRGFLALLGAALASGLSACSSQGQEDASTSEDGVYWVPKSGDDASDEKSDQVSVPEGFPEDILSWEYEEGSQRDRSFIVDNVLHSTTEGDIHFSSYVPDSYDGSRPYALYVALPGWEGLYFQGVGANLQEDFPFVAQEYVHDMIVVSAQLDSWDEASAEVAIALTQWLLVHYRIDPERVLISGNSGGGETLSYVLGMEPGLYAAALHTISRWDGDLDVLTQAQVPVYMAIGEHDDYYGPAYDREAYQQMVSRYQERGLSDEEISDLVVLDVKPTPISGIRASALGSMVAAVPSSRMMRTLWAGSSAIYRKATEDDENTAREWQPPPEGLRRHGALDRGRGASCCWHRMRGFLDRQQGHQWLHRLQALHRDRPLHLPRCGGRVPCAGQGGGCVRLRIARLFRRHGKRHEVLHGSCILQLQARRSSALQAGSDGRELPEGRIDFGLGRDGLLCAAAGYDARHLLLLA